MPVSYVWYRDPVAGVWKISVPPNPDRAFSVADFVGLGYIQVALREHGKNYRHFRYRLLQEPVTLALDFLPPGPSVGRQQ